MPVNDESPLLEEGYHFCSLEEFTQLNRDVGIEENDVVRYFKGNFTETKERLGEDLKLLQPAAIVNLDSDLKSSTAAALELLADKFVQGTVLLVDDWSIFSAKSDAGPRPAISEFLSEHPNITFEKWFSYFFVGQSFIVHVD